ncbi:MAG: hypothetical protein EBV03_11350, partial [Proteobacteria bacterium]|nr:hypothetical protein [Pseudomonadota bacterium]
MIALGKETLPAPTWGILRRNPQPAALAELQAQFETEKTALRAALVTKLKEEKFLENNPGYIDTQTGGRKLSELTDEQKSRILEVRADMGMLQFMNRTVNPALAYDNGTGGPNGSDDINLRAGYYVKARQEMGKAIRDLKTKSFEQVSGVAKDRRDMAAIKAEGEATAKAFIGAVQTTEAGAQSVAKGFDGAARSMAMLAADAIGINNNVQAAGDELRATSEKLIAALRESNKLSLGQVRTAMEPSAIGHTSVQKLMRESKPPVTMQQLRDFTADLEKKATTKNPMPVITVDNNDPVVKVLKQSFSVARRSETQKAISELVDQHHTETRAEGAAAAQALVQGLHAPAKTIKDLGKAAGDVTGSATVEDAFELLGNTAGAISKATDLGVLASPDAAESLGVKVNDPLLIVAQATTRGTMAQQRGDTAEAEKQYRIALEKLAEYSGEKVEDLSKKAGAFAGGKSGDALMKVLQKSKNAKVKAVAMALEQTGVAKQLFSIVGREVTNMSGASKAAGEMAKEAIKPQAKEPAPPTPPV